MRKPYRDFYTAFHWLESHPAMWYWGRLAMKAMKNGCYETAFPANLDVDVVKVNPETNSIDDDKSKNTATRIWIEVATYANKDKYQERDGWPEDAFKGYCCHDYQLDCGGATYEEAIIKLANLVWKHYGIYGHRKSNQNGKKNRVMTMPRWFPKYAKEDHCPKKGQQ